MTLIARAVVVRLIQDWWSTDLPLARSHLQWLQAQTCIREKNCARQSVSFFDPLTAFALPI